MARRNSDHGIENEPHISGQFFTPDPSESKADHIIEKAEFKENIHDQAERSVWDEPAYSPELTGEEIPNNAINYERWLSYYIKHTSSAYSWGIVFLVAIVAGPWSILGTLLQGYTQGDQTWFGKIMITMIGPVTEEIMKIALPLWIIEKRPFLFRNRFQIAICVILSGFIFSVVENLIYFYVYFPMSGIIPSPEIINWRWTVCVALHTGCSFIAGMGLMRVWTHTIENRVSPDLLKAPVYIEIAIFIHGFYNFFASEDFFF